eukprot:5827135-Amphidinium_carterae.1
MPRVGNPICSKGLQGLELCHGWLGFDLWDRFMVAWYEEEQTTTTNNRTCDHQSTHVLNVLELSNQNEH